MELSTDLPFFVVNEVSFSSWNLKIEARRLLYMAQPLKICRPEAKMQREEMNRKLEEKSKTSKFLQSVSLRSLSCWLSNKLDVITPRAKVTWQNPRLWSGTLALPSSRPSRLQPRSHPRLRQSWYQTLASPHFVLAAYCWLVALCPIWKCKSLLVILRLTETEINLKSQ